MCFQAEKSYDLSIERRDGLKLTSIRVYVRESIYEEVIIIPLVIEGDVNFSILFDEDKRVQKFALN
jgi:hypothetical protein